MINTFSGRLAAFVLALSITSAFAAPFVVVAPPTTGSHRSGLLARSVPALRVHLPRATEPVS